MSRVNSIKEILSSGKFAFVIDPESGECFDGVIWRSFSECGNSTSVVIRFLEPCPDFNLEDFSHG